MTEPNQNSAPGAQPQAPDEVLIGRCIQSPDPGERGRDLWLGIDCLAKHLLAIGGTGSGKTVLLKVIAESMIAKGIPCVLLDVMGDMSGIMIPAFGPESYREHGFNPPDKLGGDAWVVGKRVAERLASTMHVRYLTPKSDTGERMAIHPLTPRPVQYDLLVEQEPDELTRMAKEAALVFMQRCGMSVPRTQQGGPELFASEVITEAFLEAWKQDTDLTGPDALTHFFDMVASNPNGLPKAEGKRFSMGIRSLAMGESRRWLVGCRLDWNDILTAPQGKVPVVVVGLSELRQSERPWVVAVILNSLFQWAASQPSNPGRPRVGVFLDELAGGSKNHESLLPPANYISASGDAIRRCLRKGRHYGICMINGTQDPHDIDRASFGQYNTKFVGKIIDPKAAKALVEASNVPVADQKAYIQALAMAENGQLFWTRPDGRSNLIRTRWLGTVHAHVKERELIRTLYRQGRLWRPPSSQVDTRHLTPTERGFCDPANRLVIYVEPFWSGSALTAIGCAVPGKDGRAKLFANESEDRLLTLAGHWIGCHGASTGVRIAVRGGWDCLAQMQALCNRCQVQLPAIDLNVYDAGSAHASAPEQTQIVFEELTARVRDYLSEDVALVTPPEALAPSDGDQVESGSDPDGAAKADSQAA